jgi:hypothetical protein
MYEENGGPLDLRGPDPRAPLRGFLEHLRSGVRDASEDGMRARHRA